METDSADNQPFPAMPDDPVPVEPANSGPTPTGYVRQANGVIVWLPPTAEELQGEFLQYQILDLIARGGMGAVYRAWQTSLQRQVAIKVLPPDLNRADTAFVERFKREAVTMASLSHPAIIAVFDAGPPRGLVCRGRAALPDAHGASAAGQLQVAQ